MVDGRVARALERVGAQSPFLLLAKAPRDVELRAELAVIDVRQRHAVERLGAGALGHQVDRAAHRARGRHAVEQRIRAAQHFDALHADQRAGVARRDAVEAVERHVVVEQREAADVELVAARAARIGVAHRGIVDQHVAQVLRLLVLYQLGRVVRGAERSVQQVAVAQQPHAAAARHLAARIGRGQAGRGVDDLHHRQRLQARAGGGRGAHDDRGAVDRGLEAAAGQQLRQRLLRRQPTGDGRRGLAGHQRGRKAQLQIGNARQFIERLAQRLGRNRDRRGAGGGRAALGPGGQREAGEKRRGNGGHQGQWGRVEARGRHGKCHPRSVVLAGAAQRAHLFLPMKTRQRAQTSG